MRKLADQLRDCLIDLSARMQRTLLLIIAVALGTGALVASIGINQTAAAQIGNQMASGTLDQINVTTKPVGNEYVFPANTEKLVKNLPAVIAATRIVQEPSTGYETTRFGPGIKVNANFKNELETVNINGVTSGYFETFELTGGTASNWVLDENANINVAYLGKKAAQKLGIPTDSEYPQGYSLYLDDRKLSVIGIVNSSERTNVDLAIIVPIALIQETRDNDSMVTLTARIKPGAGKPVANVIREQIRPDAIEKLGVSSVATLESLRSGVNSEIAKLGMTLGAMLLLLTALLIANSMIVSVVSRTSEIGLRRALGARRSGIAQIFLIEGAVTGGLGGVAGGAVGMTTIIVLSIINNWTPQIFWWLPGAGVVIGVGVGLIASLYPALSAARVNPATAIRVD